MEQTGKVDGLLLISSVGGIHLNKFCVTDNLLQTLHTHLTEVLAHLLGQEGEEVYHVLCTTLEVLAQLGVLRCHTHRTGIRITLTHHHATQHNQRQRAKRELVGTQHGHDNHILGGLQLTVGLQANLISQSVDD